MAVCREAPDISYPPQPSEDTDCVMWLVKRQAYELVFTTPNALRDGGQRVLCHAP